MNHYKFADLIWLHEPIGSRALTEICEEAFAWKRKTTYTMLNRLCDRALFQNQNGMVSALVSKSDFRAVQGEQFVNETFEGSLPLFLAAFYTSTSVESNRNH